MKRLALLIALVAGCAGDAVKQEAKKPIITVCGGCGTRWKSYGPGEPQPITKCPNCPITPEELDSLIRSGR